MNDEAHIHVHTLYIIEMGLFFLSRKSFVNPLSPLSITALPINTIFNFFFLKFFTLKNNQNADLRLVSKDRTEEKYPPFPSQDLPISLCGHRNHI